MSHFVARKVLEQTEHILIVENGAQKFALENGMPILPPGNSNIRDSLASHYSSEEVHRYCTNSEAELDGAELKEKNEKGCNSDCVIIRSDEEEVYLYNLSINSSEQLDEPTVLQVRKMINV